jgi:hypothetical protein
MRVLATLAVAAALYMVVPVTPAAAAPCGPGMVQQCKPQSYPPKAPPACRCVPGPDAGQGSYGKAEVKQKNTRQLRKNKNPGVND